MGAGLGSGIHTRVGRSVFWTVSDSFGRPADDSWRHFVRDCTTSATLKSVLSLEFCKNR